MIKRAFRDWDQDRYQRVGIIVLLIVFLALNLGSIRNKTFTTDEEKHYRYGMNILNGDSDRFDDSKMPFTALNALPAKLASFVPLSSLQTFLQKPQAGRIITMLFSLGVAYFIFHWSRSLFGVLPGLLALCLYVFDPNIIAHSRLITTDIYAAGMGALTIFTFWRFSKQRNWKTATAFALALGFSQLAKYTSAYLLPILIIITLLRDFGQWRSIIRKRDSRAAWQRIKVGARNVLFFLIVSVLIINLGFLFNQTLTPLSEYEFRSELFQSLQVRLAPIGNLPIPTPYPFLDGLDWVQARERVGHGYGRLYMLGELRRGEGFTGYYIFASLLKMPIATQILVIAAFVLYLFRWDHERFFEDDIYLLVPMVFYFIYFNFFFRAQIGIRFYLVLFPFLYVFCGGIVKGWGSVRPRVKVSIALLLIYLVGSVLAAYPHYIPYFNELIWDQKNAYKYLVDSNLDWEQGLWYLDQYLAAHPEATYDPGRPTLGTVVVSPNLLVGIIRERDRQAWLRENFEPIDIIADVYLVYEITEDKYQELRLYEE